MTSDELDKKIAEIGVRSSSGKMRQNWQLIKDLVADRERLQRNNKVLHTIAKDANKRDADLLEKLEQAKARIAELEAALNNTQDINLQLELTLARPLTATTTVGSTIQSNNRARGQNDRLILMEYDAEERDWSVGDGKTAIGHISYGHFGRWRVVEPPDHLPDAGQKVEPVWPDAYHVEKVTCRRCSGSGTEIGRYQKPAPCLDCAGTGTIDEVVESDDGTGITKPVELLTASTPVGSKVRGMGQVLELEWRDAESGGWRARNDVKNIVSIHPHHFHQFRVIAGPEEGGK